MHRLAPESWKTAGGSFPRPPAQGLALRGGADGGSARPGPKGRKSSKGRQWNRGQKERAKRECILWETTVAGVGGIGAAIPSNKDLFFSAWGWGPEEITNSLGPSAFSVHLILGVALRVIKELRFPPACLWEPTGQTVSHIKQRLRNVFWELEMGEAPEK